MRRKIIDLLNKFAAPFILFIVWLGVTIPNIKIYWMMIDDGYDVVFARTLFEKLSNFDFIGFGSQLLEGIGRFRPVYWIYHMWVWLIGENSFQLHHFMHMLVIGTTVLFVYLIVRELTKSNLISLLSALFYFLVPLNTENIIRLGPQEPLMSMFFAIFFYLIIKTKRIFLPCLMLVLAVFAKETALAILPVLLIYYVYERKFSTKKEYKVSLKFLVTIAISSLIMVVITLLRRGGYNANYSFDISMIFENLFIYFKELGIGTSLLFPVIPSLYLIRVLIKLLKKDKVFETKIDLFEFIFFASFVCFLVIQLPWAYALTRYLMPAMLFLTMFIFLEIYSDVSLLMNIKFVNRFKKVICILLSAIALYTFSLWGLNIVLIETSSISLENVFRKISEVPKNTVILMNMKEGDSTIELVYETQIILNEFWRRPDLKSDYLNLENLPKDKYIVIDSLQFPRKYQKDELVKVFGSEYFSSEKTSRRLVLTTPLELVKQSMKKVAKQILNNDNEKFSSEGLYTYYYSYSNWYFFNEK